MSAVYMSGPKRTGCIKILLTRDMCNNLIWCPSRNGNVTS